MTEAPDKPPPGAEQADRTREPPAAPPRRSATPLSGALAVLVAIGVLAIFALAYFQQDDAVAVLVVKRDIPAFRAIGPRDVKADMRPSDEQGRGVYLRELPDSRITLHGISAGDPIRAQDLGPPVADARRVIGIEATRAAVLAGAVRPGDIVQLAVPPKGGRRASLRATVLAATPDPGASTYALVVAIGRREAKRYGRFLGTAKVVLWRDLQAGKR